MCGHVILKCIRHMWVKSKVLEPRGGEAWVLRLACQAGQRIRACGKLAGSEVRVTRRVTSKRRRSESGLVHLLRASWAAQRVGAERAEGYRLWR